MTERAEDAQLATLRAFTFLTSLRPDWAGALIVVCGLSAGGEQFSIAANIAGAGFLAIESRPEICRAAMRSGACDFIVNSVDEALRILKNEIRKRKPVSVALSMDESPALHELLERGVQPELFAAFGEATQHAEAAAHRFSALGATVAECDRKSGLGLDADVKLEEFTSRHGLSSVAFLCLNAEQLRARDAELLHLVPSADPRRRWFASAPRFFHRERPPRRLAYLTSAERDRLGMNSVDLQPAAVTPEQP
jgi:urocanate hydratase